MKRLSMFLSVFGLLACLSCSEPSVADDKEPVASAKDKDKIDTTEAPKKVIKSDAEWQKILPREVFWVTRQKGTERANTGKYAQYKGKGTFACVCCDAELFNAANKFESGTGWPSFDRPILAKNIVTKKDTSMFQEVRVEVMCATCGAHLGHVFSDGPTRTGLRYCVNSVALKLVKPPAAPAKSKTAAKTKTETPKTIAEAPKAKSESQPK